MNGTAVTLVINNTTLFTNSYSARVIDGVTYALNYGLVGLGSNQSRGKFDNVAVQVLPPAVTYQSTPSFDTTTSASVFGGSLLGNWSVADPTPEQGHELYQLSLADDKRVTPVVPVIKQTKPKVW